MNEDMDVRIANLLSAHAPPPRDPVFRVRVLERREQQRFQRRLYTMLAATLVVLLVSAFAIGAGTGSLEAMGALVVSLSLACAHFAFRGSLLRILWRFTI
jgi:uncharacterized membrane protein